MCKGPFRPNQLEPDSWMFAGLWDSCRTEILTFSEDRKGERIALKPELLHKRPREIGRVSSTLPNARMTTDAIPSLQMSPSQDGKSGWVRGKTGSRVLRIDNNAALGAKRLSSLWPFKILRSYNNERFKKRWGWEGVDNESADMAKPGPCFSGRARKERLFTCYEPAAYSRQQQQTYAATSDAALTRKLLFFA